MAASIEVAAADSIAAGDLTAVADPEAEGPSAKPGITGSGFRFCGVSRFFQGDSAVFLREVIAGVGCGRCAALRPWHRLFMRPVIRGTAAFSSILRPSLCGRLYG